MGQKVNPHGLRVGVIKDWDSKWYAEADFADNLVEDHKIRTYLKKKLYSAGISKIEIERASDKVKIVIYTAKPGVVIGKGDVYKRQPMSLAQLIPPTSLVQVIAGDKRLRRSFSHTGPGPFRTLIVSSLNGGGNLVAATTYYQ